MTGFVRMLSEGFPKHRGRKGKQGGSMPKSAGTSPASAPSAQFSWGDLAMAKNIVREEIITKKGGAEVGKELAAVYGKNPAVIEAARERLEYYTSPELRTDKDFKGVRTRLQAFMKEVKKRTAVPGDFR